MNDITSLLLATAVLTVGGLGLYMYKLPDDGKGTNYDENIIFGSGVGSQESYTEGERDEEDDEQLETKIRTKTSKTKRNKKGYGSKRRY